MNQLLDVPIVINQKDPITLQGPQRNLYIIPI